MVASPSVFVLGGAGASQLPGCEGGNVLSQLWSLVVVASVGFCFGGRRGPVSFRACSEGEWRRVSFRGL